MSIDQPFVEKQLFGKQSYVEKKGKKKIRSLAENAQVNGDTVNTDV
jgi:hypothetical protein